MKKTITYILYILVLCAVVACDNGDREIVEPMYDKVVFNAVADSPSTRTALIFGGGKYQATWKAGDTFRIVQIANGEKSVYSGTVAEDCLRLSSIAEFETKIADEYVYLFGYPTLSMNSLCTYVAFTLPAEQNPTTIDTFDGNADMLLSECVVRKSQPIGEPIRFNIKRLSSIGKFTVKNLVLAEDDKVKSVTFSCTKPISGKITNLQLSDLMAGDISIENSTFVEDQNYNYVKVSLAEPQSEEFTYYMSCWPTTLAAGEQYTIVIETEQDEYVKTATLPFDLVFEQNEITTLTVNMAGVVAKNAAPATYKILYTSTDGKVVTPYKTNVFGANIVSNTYENGQGVITFDAEVTSIGEKAFYNRSKLASITFPNSATLIGDFAFTECSSLTSVTIQNGVTSIGKSAFYLCSKLSYITIPESVTSFGDYVFKACYDLLSITIPESVTSIGQEAFYSCSSLTNATIPDSVTKIGDGTFQNCSNLATVTIGSGVTSIGERAFYNCSNLASVTIPDSVTKIESEAFYGCSSITSAVISNSLTSINSSMFYNCSSLTTVTIPNSITSISHSAFYGCSSLTSVTIPSNVTSLGYDAFYKCSNLKDVYCKPTTPPTLGHDVFYNNATDRKIYVPAAAVDTYKTATNWSSYADAIVAEEGSSDENRKIYYTSIDGEVVTPYKTDVFGANIVSNTYENGQGVITFDGAVTSIGNIAFASCSGLTSVTIPDSVTSIGESAFNNCSSLTSVTIPDSVTSIGNYAFAYCSSLTSVTIPDSVTSIGNYAFLYCSSLISVIIGNNVTSIGSYVFRNCSSLTSVTIPDSVTSIRESAFDYCSSLTSVTIGNSVTSIEDYAFYDCSSLTSVTIGNSVTSIGYGAFYNCYSLTSVYCKPTTPPTLSYSVFDNNAADRKIYVPAEAVDAYKTADGWKDYADVIEAEPELELCQILYTSTDGNIVTPYRTDVFGANIVSNTYENGQGEIVFDSDVTKIGNSAFWECRKLASVIIPDSVTSIGDWAFGSCDNLANVTIPNNVTQIGAYAFYQCANITTITIPQSITTLGANPFMSCENLAEFDGKFASDDKRCLVIDNEVRSFAPSGLTEYSVLDGTTSIGQSVFEYCKLGAITLPNSITKIGDSAFRCSRITSMVVPDQVTTIERAAFYGCAVLPQVTIGVSVTTIGDDAFRECGALTSITIPERVTTIGASAFNDCTNLASVYCKPLIPPSLYTEVFENNATDRKFYVPAESLDAYKAASGWSAYADAICSDEVDLSQYTDLSAEGTANCYLVKSLGNYKLKAVKGNSTVSVGDAQSASVLWETFGTDVMPNVGDLVRNVGYKDGYVYFSTPTTFANGNASIAVHDSNNTILWSWHIWCSAEGWEDDVYANNAGILMDRNLGATSAMPGSVDALGLLYQWGRKDPFLSSSSISASTDAASTGTWNAVSGQQTVDYVTANPTSYVATGGDWCTGDGAEGSNYTKRWMESGKTMYDPCPVGYRVPKGDVDGFWVTALGTSSATSEGTTWDDTNKGRHWTLADGTTAWYPAVGYRYSGSGALNSVGSSGFYWSASRLETHSSHLIASSLQIGVYEVNPGPGFVRSHGYSVRCVRE